MKTKQISWIILLLAMLPALLIAQSKDRDQQSVALSSPGRPFKLNMNLAGGSVNINTYDGKELRITASIEKNSNGNAGGGKNQNVNINTNTNVNVNSGAASNNANKNKLLKVLQNNNEVVINQLNQNKALNVEISLPKTRTALNLSLSGRNNVNVDGVAGEIEVTSADGPVTLKNISGSAVITTINGNIIASFTNVNAKAPMAFSTLIGNIDLSFPSTFKGSVSMKSDEGTISSDFNLKGTAKTKLINGGGQAISISNMQGNIYLRKRS